MDAGLGGLHWINLIMNGRSWTGEVENPIDLNIERKRNVVPNQFEARLREKMGDIRLLARKEIVNAKNVVSLVEQAFAKMRAQEACTTGSKNSFHCNLLST